MATSFQSLWPALVALLLGFGDVGTAGPNTTQVLMREKLESAHAILDGLALGDFAKIELNAERLKNISRATGWQKADVPDFAHFAKSFQNSADYLAEQAKAKNLEGVSMGYVRVTLDCLQCHHAIRDAGKDLKQ